MLFRLFQDRSQTIIKPMKHKDTFVIEYRLYRYVYNDIFEPIETHY